MSNSSRWLLNARVFNAVESVNRRWSRVADAPFYDTRLFPWVAQMEACTADILRELKAVQQTTNIPAIQMISREQSGLTRDNRWKTFFLHGVGKATEENAARCPATSAALKRIPGMKSALFSILSPRKKIPPHRGIYNGVLRYHLGLVVPEPDRCAFRVGDQTRRWAVGSSLLFDDTYEHEVTNESEQERIVLIVDFARPLRWPMNLVNEAMMEAIRKSPLATEAEDNLLRFNAKQRTKAAATGIELTR